MDRKAGGGAASYRAGHAGAARVLRAPGYEDTVGVGEPSFAAFEVLGTEANRRAALRRLARTAAHEAIERFEISARFKN